MEMETAKLFIGGISWDTSEERLREYFEDFGEVIEAVIMKDRTTGRARGFGFVVFANASVADKVARERHIIDGRTMEAKKAVPRDDLQNTSSRNSGSIQGSPVLTRTKKIFVGGLASTVTEIDFKTYFDQFGTITDVVVMYDHNTKRPRGFGFITYDSEEAVDKVLIKTFHELNGKMVEVKRAVPKELSPGPIRSPSSGYNYVLNGANSLLNAYSAAGYNNSISMGGGYGMRMDGPFSPIGRSGYPPHSPSSYNMGLNFDSGFNLSFGANENSGLGYGRAMGSYYGGNTNRFGYDLGNDGNGPLLNTTNRNMWSNASLNYNTNSVTSNAFPGSSTGNGRVVGNFGNSWELWGSSNVTAQSGGSGSFTNANIGYASGESNFRGRASYGRNNGGIVGAKPSYSVENDVGDGAFGNLYGDDSHSSYGNHGWRTSSPELEGPVSFGYGRGAAADVARNGSIG